MQHSHSEGSDLTGSNTAEAEDDPDPSNEAEDRSCWVTVTGVSVVGVSGEVLVTSETGARGNKEMLPCDIPPVKLRETIRLKLLF